MQCSSADTASASLNPTAQRGGLRFQSHLINLVMAVLVPMFIFSVVMIVMHVQQARSTRSELLRNMALEAAERVDSHLRRTVAGLQTLGQSDALSNHDLRAFHALADRLVKAERWDHIALLGPSGEHFLNTRKPFGSKLAPLNRPDLPMKAAASRQPLVSDITDSLKAIAGEGKPDGFLTVLYVPVVQRETVKYVIAVAIEPATWQKLIQDPMGNAEGMEAVLLDPQSKVIAGTYQNGNGPEVGSIQRVSVDASVNEQASSSGHVTSVGGQSAYAASYKTEVAGWTVLTFAPTETFDSPFRQTTLFMAGAFLLLLLTGLWAALLLGRRTASSISQLVASVRAVAAGGAPLPLKSSIAEVTEASQAVNETAALLAARRSELEAADQAKNKFLAVLGHELRNPLAPIRNCVQLLKQVEPGSQTALSAVDVIDRQSAHLSRLVDDLLDVTRIDHGKIELRNEVLDLGQLLQGTVDDARGLLEQAGIVLTLDLPPAPVLANCDRVRLAQIVGNLLHNARKFTPRGGHIIIRLTREDPLAIVEVRDNGSGILPEHLEKIFDLFAQEQPSGAGGNTGLGIGLALTRKLVKLHGGTITATSAGRGQGSTFRIELPAVFVEPEDGGATGTAAPIVDTAGARARVLVVDDNQDCADTLGELLEMSGFAITVVYSGQAALHAVEHQRPDAVLLDIGLPDINGLEVCRRIRRSVTGRQPMLIALTGWGQENDRELAVKAGFDAHLTKPANAGALIAMLQSFRRNERSCSEANTSSAIAAGSSACVHQSRECAAI
jgi:signal transduction histidine kinase/ActR/RegA family two-component response regulator